MNKYIYIYNVHVRYQQHSFRHVWNWNGPCFFEIKSSERNPAQKKESPLQQLWHSFEKKTTQCRLKDLIWRTSTHYIYIYIYICIWWASTCCIATEDQKGTQLRFTEFLERKRKSCQMRFFLKRNKSEKISPEMWRFLKRTISEQESHKVWWFLKRRKSEKKSHQVWKFLKRKITEKKSQQIWWFLERTNLNWKQNHSKCESSWQGNFLKRNGIKYSGSWKGQIWKDFTTSNVKVPGREKLWKEITSYMIVIGKGKQN